MHVQPAWRKPLDTWTTFPAPDHISLASMSSCSTNYHFGVFFNYRMINGKAVIWPPLITSPAKIALYSTAPRLGPTA